MGRSMRFTLRCKVALVAGIAATMLTAVPAVGQEDQDASAHKEVAEYVKERILDGDFGDRTLWMTETPLDDSYVARNLIRDKHPDLPFPYSRTWLVMIDDHPDANFAHPVRWLFVKADLAEHSDPVKRDFPPLVLSDGGRGEAVAFRCVAVTPKACPETAVVIPEQGIVPVKTDKDCLYAVLVSGGISSGANYNRYRQNLRSMYQILRGSGYPKSNIFVYYADGSALDLDNADGDNNDTTGDDVTGGADESPIRAKIQKLCDDLDPRKDILFTYFSNHGADDDGVCLWDGNGNGLESGELYAPAELAADTADCTVCRHFMIHDQCFAGDFLPMANDGNHDNLAVYAAASATEVSWGREYMAQWETNDPKTTTMNAMHQDVVANGNLNSTPGTAEGTAGIGNNSAAVCCGLTLLPWRWIIVIILVIIVILAVSWRLRRKA